MKKLEEETYQNVSYTPKINETSKKFKRNLSDLFEWQRKVEEKNEALFELTYGKQKKHLFSNKSAKSIGTFNYEKKEENKNENKKSLKKVSSCTSIKYSRKINVISKKDLNKEFNQFRIKEFNCEKEAEAKVVQIETLDYVPMSTRITNFNSGINSKKSETDNNNNNLQMKINPLKHKTMKTHSKNFPAVDVKYNNNNNLNNTSRNKLKLETNDMSFNIKNQSSCNKNNDCSDTKEEDKQNNINNESFDRTIVPVYLNFKGNLNELKNEKQNNIDDHYSNDKNKKINNSDKQNMRESLNDLREKKIDEFYKKLQSQPIIDDFNNNKINKNSNESSFKVINSNSNKSNINSSNFKNNETNERINLQNNFSSKKNQKKKETFKMQKENKPLLRNRSKILSSNDSAKINNPEKSVSEKLIEDKKDMKNNKSIDKNNKNNEKANLNSHFRKASLNRNNSSLKNLNLTTTPLKNSNKNSDSNSILKPNHQRYNSQTPIDFESSKGTSKLAVNKDKKTSSKKNLLIKNNVIENNSNYENLNSNRNKNQNMNEVKKHVNLQNIQEIKLIKKDQILESRKFLNEFLNKRNRELNDNCKSNGNKINNNNNNVNVSNSWRKNIQINMSDS